MFLVRICYLVALPLLLALMSAADAAEKSSMAEGHQFKPVALGSKVPVVTDNRELSDFDGRLVAIRGIVSNTKVPTVIGVDVRVDDKLRGREAYAIGILRRSEVTQEQLDAEFAERGAFATRGPGVYYTLYFDLSGKLAEARAWPVRGESQGSETATRASPHPPQS